MNDPIADRNTIGIDAIKNGGDPIKCVDGPVDLREIHKLWMSLSTDITCESPTNSQRYATIHPQVDDGPIDLVFTRQYKALRTFCHPAVAAVIAHQNATNDPYHVRPLARIDAA